jgi:hypothetical protein
MTRRIIGVFVTVALTIFVAPLATAAPPHRYRIGRLSAGSPPPDPAFRQTLRTLGYVEGDNLRLEERYAEGQEDRLPALAAQHRLPAMFRNPADVEAGGLMAYGPNFSDIWRRAAVYVDKILKGARPADLPVEQPTTFELVINLKTVQALGITIPPTLLFQATEVIR